MKYRKYRARHGLSIMWGVRGAAGFIFKKHGPSRLPWEGGIWTKNGRQWEISLCTYLREEHYRQRE